MDEKYTVNYTRPHLTLIGMIKGLASINLEHFDVIYTPSNHLLRGYMTENKKDH